MRIIIAYLSHGSVEVQILERIKIDACSIRPSIVSLPGMVLNWVRIEDGKRDELVHPQHAYDLDVPSEQAHGVSKEQSKSQQPKAWVPLAHSHW